MSMRGQLVLGLHIEISSACHENCSLGYLCAKQSHVAVGACNVLVVLGQSMRSTNFPVHVEEVRRIFRR